MAIPSKDGQRTGAQNWKSAGLIKSLTRTVLGQIRFLNERRGSLPGLFTSVDVRRGTKGPEYLYTRGVDVGRGEELQESNDFKGIDLESYGVDFERWTGVALLGGRLLYQEYTGQLLDLTRQAFGIGLQRASEISALSVIEEVTMGSANLNAALTLDSFIDILQHIKLGWQKQEYRPLTMGAPNEIRFVLHSGQMTPLYKSLMLAYQTNAGGERNVNEYQGNERLLNQAVSDLRLPGGVRVLEDNTIVPIGTNATGLLFGAGSIVRANAAIGRPVFIDDNNGGGDVYLEVNNWFGDNIINPYVIAKITSSVNIPTLIG